MMISFSRCRLIFKKQNLVELTLNCLQDWRIRVHRGKLCNVSSIPIYQIIEEDRTNKILLSSLNPLAPEFSFKF